MSEQMTIGHIEQLTMTPKMKDRWQDNVQFRIATGKTIQTSCVLAAQAKIDMLEEFLRDTQERLDESELSLAHSENSRRDEVAVLSEQLNDYIERCKALEAENAELRKGASPHA